jgi:hypothetical protein
MKVFLFVCLIVSLQLHEQFFSSLAAVTIIDIVLGNQTKQINR